MHVDDWLRLLLSGVLTVVLLGLSAVFSGSEAALFSLSRVQLERAAASANPARRRVARLLERPKDVLLTILISNTAVNIALFANTYVLFTDLAGHLGAWIVPVAGAASVLVVVLIGEVLPKTAGVAMPDRLAPLCATIVGVVGVVAGPVGRLVDALLAEPFVRVVLGPERARAAADLSADELKALLALSRQSGTLRPLEDMLLRPIVDLASTRVADVMVPRVAMRAYDGKGSADGLRQLMRETHHKKIPVYDGDLDNIIGLVYAKVLFFNPHKPLRELAVPVRFVPALASCEQLLQHFRSTKSQVAIAVDEFGGVAGLVTLEDVIEQIVGKLHDPEDQPTEPELQARDDGSYEISGQLNVRYWIEAFGLSERDERVATIGGLVMAQLGRPAVEGDVVRLGNVELRVTRVRARRIERLCVTPLAAPVAEGGAQ